MASAAVLIRVLPSFNMRGDQRVQEGEPYLLWCTASYLSHEKWLWIEMCHWKVKPVRAEFQQGGNTVLFVCLHFVVYALKVP